MVPFDTESPFVTSGIRIGTPAITTRGLKEEDCRKVVAWMDRVLSDIENEQVIQTVRQEVNAFMANFPLFQSTEEGVAMASEMPVAK